MFFIKVTKPVEYLIILLTIVFSLISVKQIKAQDDTCGTIFKAGVPLSVAAPYGNISNLELYKLSTMTTPIRLAVHIVTYSNGSGGLNLETLNLAMENLNNAFKIANMQFYIYKIDNIMSDTYATLQYGYGGEMDELRKINVVPASINVYFVPSFPGLCGEGSPTPDLYNGEQGIIIANKCANTSSFPHEMGHYFNLFHTH